MSNILGNILVMLGLDSVGFLDGMSKAETVAKNTGKEIEHAFDGIGGAIEGALAPLGEFGGMLGAAFNQVGSAINSALQGVTEFAGGGGLGLIAGAAAGVVAAAGAMDAVFVGIAIHATENANKIYELSEKTGIAVSALSAFTEVGHVFGIGTEEMAKALEKMNKSVFAAANAPAGAVNAYTRLGISLRDTSGQLRPVNDILLDVADKFDNMPDGVQKTALALQIFGRSGAEMIPFLNEGKEGIAKFTDAAQKMGAVLTEEAAASAHQFQVDLSLLKIGVDGVENRIMTALVPALNVVADQFVAAMEEPQGPLSTILDAVVGLTKYIISFGETVAFAFNEAGIVVGNFIAILMTLSETEANVTERLMHLDFSGAYDAAKDGMRKVVAEVKNAATESSKAWDGYTETLNKVFNPPAPPPKKTRPQGDDSSEETVKQQAAEAKQILDISDARYKEQAAQAEAYYSKGEIDSKQLLDAQIFAVNAQYAAHESYFNKLKTLYANDPQKLAAVNAEKTKFELGSLTTALEGVAKAQEKWNELTTKTMEASEKENLKEQAHSMDAIGAATMSYVKSLEALANAQKQLTAAQGKGDYSAQVEAIKQEMADGLKSKREGYAEIAALDKEELGKQVELLKAVGVQLAEQQKEAEAGVLAAQKTGDTAQVREAQSFLNQIKAAEIKNKADILTADTQGNKKIVDEENKSMEQIVAARERMAEAVASTAAKAILSGKNMAQAFEKLGTQMLEQMLTNTLKMILLGDMKQAKDAGHAAASAFTWVMDEVPFPANAVVAPAAAAAAFASVMAFEQGGISDQGGLSMLHPKEMVLPSDISLGLQAMIKGARMPGQGYMASPSSNNSQAAIQPAIASAANQRMRNSPSVKMTVVTPNADSFMASQSQIQSKMHKAQSTAMKRNR